MTSVADIRLRWTTDTPDAVLNQVSMRDVLFLLGEIDRMKPVYEVALVVAGFRYHPEDPYALMAFNTLAIAVETTLKAEKDGGAK